MAGPLGLASKSLGRGYDFDRICEYVIGQKCVYAFYEILLFSYVIFFFNICCNKYVVIQNYFKLLYVYNLQWKYQ